MRMRLWPHKLGVAALGFAVVAGAMAPTAQAATANRARLTHAQSVELAHETVTVIRVTPRESVIHVSAPKGVGHDSDCVVGLWNGSSYGAPYGENICGTEEVSIDTLRLARHGAKGKSLTALLDQYRLTTAVNELTLGSQPHRALWDTTGAALLLAELVNELADGSTRALL